MEIARERFLDDTRRYHLTLSLRSRTNEMHSMLGDLSADERDAVGSALVRALDEIQGLLTVQSPRFQVQQSSAQKL